MENNKGRAAVVCRKTNISKFFSILEILLNDTLAETGIKKNFLKRKLVSLVSSILV